MAGVHTTIMYLTCQKRLTVGCDAMLHGKSTGANNSDSMTLAICIDRDACSWLWMSACMCFAAYAC